VVLTPRRWRQVRGSHSRAKVANKPGHLGERVISRKTIAQGRPDVSAEPVCSCAFLFAHFCTRDRGCSAHPVFPAPFDFNEGGNLMANLGRKRREIAKLCLRMTRCVKSESVAMSGEITSHEMSSLRKQGPITTDARCYKPSGPSVKLHRRGVWVPAFAGTTLRNKTDTPSPHARQSWIQSCRASTRSGPIALMARSRASAIGPVR
jgi:hypothetical protein